MKHTIKLIASYLRQLQLCIIPEVSSKLCSPSQGIISWLLNVHPRVLPAVNCQVVIVCRQAGQQVCNGMVQR
jgi:hypothetical protein